MNLCKVALISRHFKFLWQYPTTLLEEMFTANLSRSQLLFSSSGIFLWFSSSNLVSLRSDIELAIKWQIKAWTGLADLQLHNVFVRYRYVLRYFTVLDYTECMKNRRQCFRLDIFQNLNPYNYFESLFIFLLNKLRLISTGISI